MALTKYITLDGRKQDGGFHTCVTDALKDLKQGEGLHIIHDFEPLPLYDLMEKKGFERRTEQVSENEYHVWFAPKSEALQMKQHLELDNEKMDKIMDIKLKVFRKEMSPVEAKALVNRTFDKITAEEFAYGEQQMLSYGISDEAMVDDMDSVIDVFKDVLETFDLQLPEGHPIHTYQQESMAIELVLKEMEQLLKAKFIKNQWLALYDKLQQINIHFSRKQNQLFSALELKGFDRPSKVMWSFDNKVRDAIKAARLLLEANDDKAFIEAQGNVIFLVRDILEKESEVLYPTSVKLLTNAEFAQMRISDDEIGYCLIDTPPSFNVNEAKAPENSSDRPSAPAGLMNDLSAVLQKHGLSGLDPEQELDVSMGKLTLERINMIFKHLQVDLSYVDENDVVKFYSDTKHRVFPRSAGVIGRKVQNCHPRESVETVEEIIEAFKKGEQDKAEFWLEMGDKFIYIIYNAVHDEEGQFRGVLEMMQDVTHIRSLTGSQRLLSWSNKDNNDVADEAPEESEGLVSGSSIIGSVIKQYPFIKDLLIKQHPNFSLLNNPIVFKTMGKIASIEMIAKRGGLDTNDLVEKINDEIKRNKE